jgi:hypothetical protein
MQAAIVKPSLDDSWRYAPDTAWGPCISKLVKHEEANSSGPLALKDHAPLTLGLRVTIDSDAAMLYEDGVEGEWYVEGIGRPVDGEPAYAMVRLRDLKTQVYCLSPSHWLTAWKPPAPKEETMALETEVKRLVAAISVVPTSDDQITCFLCRKSTCTHEFTFRGDGSRSALGAHEDCLREIEGVVVSDP